MFSKADHKKLQDLRTELDELAKSTSLQLIELRKLANKREQLGSDSRDLAIGSVGIDPERARELFTKARDGLRPDQELGEHFPDVVSRYREENSLLSSLDNARSQIIDVLEQHRALESAQSYAHGHKLGLKIGFAFGAVAGISFAGFLSMFGFH